MIVRPISYDWRGMFIQNQIVCGSMKLVMAYDGSGRRISKTRMRDYGKGVWETQSITHYTGIDTEIRENFSGESPETKVVVNMPVFFRVTLTRLKPRSYIEKDILRLSNGGAILPKRSFGASRQGLGRYGIENADGMAKGDEFYLKNHLGSTMMVAQVSSTNASEPAEITAAYDYRAFGEQVTLKKSADKVTENFTGKEKDDETELNYFGARYFDPFFGLWMSPDPAGQYANPYTYGGDPVNFIDPTGLWGFDTGFFTIGWDSNRGWNFGMSAGIFSYTWYQNGSKTFEATIGGSYQWYFLNLGGSIGYSYNTYSGHSLSAGGHVCVGAKEDEAGVCAGLEAGANMYWDAYGNFLGATAYAGPFAELQASDNTSLVKVNGGYETGLFGMEGRGWYGGVSAKDGSLYASWAENGGWSYGATVVKLQYNSEGSDYLRMSLMGYSFNLAERLKADVNFHRENYALKQSAENGNYDEDGFFVIAGHGRNKNGKGYILNEHTGALMDAEAVAEMIKADPRYNEGMNIKLASCQNSIMAKELSLIFKNVIVKGPSDNLVSGVLGDWIENGGTWDSYMNGKLVSSQKNGIFSRFWN